MKLLVLFCLFYFLFEIRGSFIKPNNIPRVGRSNEADGPFDQNSMGYVIKTIPNKNIPRMGRRNYDSENSFDIPKLYQVPVESEVYRDEGQLEAYYGNQYENLKR
ncbi:uncharacterized protein LOC126378555 [Pectinophora gossypiella]|uniref:uncharacterized protein LOC126378555 n=1 Tax=Pectinophora gossypiella TaxID=13191 RepID=UPI00214E8B48|nr:uncharacterized protein LOC126378555 [Pectinophora gossypiella]